MSLNRANSFQLDWPVVFIYLGLVLFGYFNIVSAATGSEFISFFDISKPYGKQLIFCLLYTSPSPRDLSTSRMPSSA